MLRRRSDAQWHRSRRRQAKHLLGDLVPWWWNPASHSEETAEARHRVGVAGEAEGVPGHRVVARADRLAEYRFDALDDLRDTQGGARDEDRVDRIVATEFDNRRFDACGADASDLVVVLMVEGAHHRNLEAARLQPVAHHVVDPVDIGRE